MIPPYAKYPILSIFNQILSDCGWSISYKKKQLIWCVFHGIQHIDFGMMGKGYFFFQLQKRKTSSTFCILLIICKFQIPTMNFSVNSYPYVRSGHRIIKKNEVDKPPVKTKFPISLCFVIAVIGPLWICAWNITDRSLEFRTRIYPQYYWYKNEMND